MNLKTFSAPTMAEALRQVKAALGSDAVILHTRSYQKRVWMGLRRREVVEITAGKGAGQRPARRPSAASAPTFRPQVVPQNKPASLAIAAQQLLQTPGASNAVML